jgi:hypothetical protein
MRIDGLQSVDGRRAVHPHRRRSEPHPTIAAIEQTAGIITERIVAAGPLFWLALILAHLAVRLGIVS